MGTGCSGSIFVVFLLLAFVSSLLQDLAVPFHVAYFSTMITLYFPFRLGSTSGLVMPKWSYAFSSTLVLRDKGMCVIAHKVLLSNSSLNRLFLTIANVTFPYGEEFPRDTTEVFRLSGKEPSSKHAQVSSSRERPTFDICAIISLKSFRCSTFNTPNYIIVVL